MSHSTLTIFRWQVCRTNSSLSRWVWTIASVQLHWPLNHDFLANIPIGRRNNNKKRIFWVSDSFALLHSSFTSMCWQWFAPPSHIETRDTCELVLSDRERHRQNRCSMRGEMRLMESQIKNASMQMLFIIVMKMWSRKTLLTALWEQEKNVENEKPSWIFFFSVTKNFSNYSSKICRELRSWIMFLSFHKSYALKSF